MTDQPSKTANALAEERTDLAVERTAMAASRTMMAWIRTGTSLISFGFSIHKILQAAATSTAKFSLMNEQGPRRLGLTLIFLGVMSIVLGNVEYIHISRRLSGMIGKPYAMKRDFSLLIGAIVGLIGLFLFITILFNHEVF
jgi:putative membrane protein